jgi:dienelactone hydrolase
MVAHSRPDGAKIDLTVYPGAYHAFDVVELKPGIRSLGRWLEYNQGAAEDAEEKTRTFLAANLGGASGDEPQKRDKDYPLRK